MIKMSKKYPNLTQKYVDQFTSKVQNSNLDESQKWVDEELDKFFKTVSNLKNRSPLLKEILDSLNMSSDDQIKQICKSITEQKIKDWAIEYPNEVQRAVDYMIKYKGFFDFEFFNLKNRVKKLRCCFQVNVEGEYFGWE